MNWLIKQYTDPAIFYAIFAAIWTGLGMWVGIYPVFWASWVQVMLGAYLVLTAWVILQVVWATITRKKEE